MKCWVHDRPSTEYVTAARSISRVVANVMECNRHVSDLLLVGDGGTSPIDVATLDQYDASRVDVCLAHLEESPPFMDVWIVDQVARQESDVELLDESQRRDVSENGVHTLDVAQHRWGVVDADDAVTERQQRMRDPANTATQFEDRRSRRSSRNEPGRACHRPATVSTRGRDCRRALPGAHRGQGSERRVARFAADQARPQRGHSRALGWSISTCCEGCASRPVPLGSLRTSSRGLERLTLMPMYIDRHDAPGVSP